MTALPTPFYQSPRATIYCGDSREIMPLLTGVQAVVSDPPYGINYKKGASVIGNGFANAGYSKKPIFGDDKPFDPEPIFRAFGKLRGGGKTAMPIVLCGGDHYASRLPDGGTFYCWDKACGSGSATTFADAEYIWSNRKNPRMIFHHIWQGCVRMGEDNSNTTYRKHPSLKPVELMLWLLETCRIGVGHTVIDPYMGVGTTGVACLRTGRRFIGCEIDPEYCALAADRLASEQAAFTTDQ
jgi:site-specific DNA-methyltransferase (adenine-specific)